MCWCINLKKVNMAIKYLLPNCTQDFESTMYLTDVDDCKTLFFQRCSLFFIISNTCTSHETGTVNQRATIVRPWAIFSSILHSFHTCHPHYNSGAQNISAILFIFDTAIYLSRSMYPIGYGVSSLAFCDHVALIPDSNVHVAHMGPTWVLSAPGGPHVVPTNLAIRDLMHCCAHDPFCTIHC